jgi:dehydrogenase/reductase SDR family protein 7B
MDFNGKVAWVIGASSGIGKSLAELLAQKGAKVILSSRNEENLIAVKKTLKNPQFHSVFTIDLENTANIQKDVQALLTKESRIDYLFNGGGMSQRSNAFETPMEVDRRMMEINYFGNIAVTKAILTHFQKNQSGHIIIISSIAGKFGFFLRSAYSASKHALHGFYESLRLEEEKNNIKVTIACPGKINTAISMNALNAKGEKHGVMDHNQETGMSSKECAKQILEAVVNDKKEILIGGKEIKAVTLKRLMPALFYKIIRKQSAT